MAKLNIVGVGPGSPDYVTPAAKKTVHQADLVVGAQRSLNLFTNEINSEILILTAKNLRNALEQASKSVKSGKNVALLSTGDPGFSGLLHTILESGLFSSDEINVVAGISSIQACAARLSISWDTASLFTFHDSVSEGERQRLALAVKDGRSVLLLPNPKHFAPKDIASFLITKGASPQTRVSICENITLDNEKVTSSTLEETAKLTFNPLCVMVIKANPKE
ncbi:MAG: precorrin-6y C5,15-methyltransferase (decarboxylating) subunit CbiE [Candidatus Bathyarchaeota archaeon]|nr:precorrin-6y C5,15-methyltransferase (decarboxylating) subunit CbiE [Candidatus Bathyarchaeota archaeon]